MSQAEELLNNLAEVIPEHTHAVTDTDTYFIIDPYTRQIENTNRNKSVIMQYDHNSERFTFRLPRYIDGHDMMLCTSVVVNFDNVEADTGNTVSDMCDMSKIKLDPGDTSFVVTSWLITRNVTQLAGALHFSIEFKCTDSEGNVVYEWGTDTYDRIEVKPRSKNNPYGLVEHADILEQWRTQIFGAADSVMANIAAEGEAQIEAVKTESAIQQGDIVLKGANTIASIPDDYTELDVMAEEATRSKSDAIVCESVGESITIKDSSKDHIRAMHIFGKTTQPVSTGAQLAEVNININYTYKGVLASATDDGNILVSGTTTEEMWNRLATATLVAGEKYTLSSNGALIITVWDATANTSIATKERNQASLTFTAINSGTHTFILSNPAYNVFASVRADIMVNTGSVALPWEPYSGGTISPGPDYPQELFSVDTLNCSVYGANLFPLQEVTAVGVTGIPQSNGTVKYIGVANSNAWQAYQVCPILTGGTYTLSVETINKTEKGSLIQIYDNNGLVGRSWQNVEDNFSCTFDAVAGSIVRWNIGVKPDEVVDTTIKLMLNIGSVALPWEPYVEVQSVVFKRDLCGIPVHSDGNYTDENGQQWICDEIDLERGVYIQRTKEIVLSNLNPDTWYTWGVSHTTEGVTGFYHYFTDPVVSDVVMSNIGSYSTKVWGGTAIGVGASWKSKYLIVSVNNDCLSNINTDVGATESFKTMLANTNAKMLVAIEPMERPLTAEEIEAFKALRTNYPNTTILNDAGAWMSIKYNADTKTYVENPKTLKLVDSSTGVVYELKIINGNLTVVPV